MYYKNNKNKHLFYLWSIGTSAKVPAESEEEASVYFSAVVGQGNSLL